MAEKTLSTIVYTARENLLRNPLKLPRKNWKGWFEKLLWNTSPKKVQMLFEVAAIVADPLLLLDRIHLYGGDEQAMAIQLLGTHLIVQDTLAARGVR